MSKLLSDLVPEFAPQAKELLEACDDLHIVMRVTETLRTPFTQAKLWRQSRTSAVVKARIQKLRNDGAPFLAHCLESVGPQSGDPVTNALPGLSWHQWGEAMDCVWIANGKETFSLKLKVGGLNGFHVYAEQAEKMKLTAGGFFKSIKDFPHVQLRPEAGPQSKHSLPEIDAEMKRRFGP
jgi:peptidoglycan L-alanyl-D-glutamate endopeptidase CwlK